MERKGVRQRRPPAQRRECERASSRGVGVRLAATSLLRLAQVQRPQWPAIVAQAQPRTPATKARKQYRYVRFPPPQWPTTGSRHTPEPSARPSRYAATSQAAQSRPAVRKLQTPLSTQTSIREWRLPPGRIAAPLLDTDSAGQGCSGCEFPWYAAP